MDFTHRERIWTPPQRAAGGRAIVSNNVPCGPGITATPAQPRLIDFQPLTTIMVPGSADIVPEACAIQPFSGWFDGAGITEVHFKVEVLQADDATVHLESSPVIDADVDQWVGVRSWDAPISTPGYEIIRVISSSGDIGAGLYRFSRYIRWRVARTAGGTAGHTCFRIKAIVGASFTQWAEKPRVV